jgi:N4-gp56 family major capsid protein
MALTASTDALRPELWQKELYKDVMDNLYFNKFMGEGINNIVQTKSDLKKSKGDTVTIPLTTKLSGDGVTGDSELEGNEEAISPYSDSISIDQWRTAVRLTGKLDEQKNVFDMRMDAKNKLSIHLQEFIERQIFMKLAGVNNTTITDVNDNIVAANCLWSNTPDQVPTADTAAGYGTNYLCADWGGATSLATTDLISPELISRAKVKANTTASPRMIPLKISGKNYWVMFIHPWQAFDLKNNATFAQAQREAQSRGDENPIFTGALGVWDGVILHEHEYVPFLDIAGGAGGGNNFYAAASGTNFAAVDAFRALLCGQQAAAFVQTGESMGMIEETFDYKNKVGYATGLIGGIQKVSFNDNDYGVIAVDTAATALV